MALAGAVWQEIRSHATAQCRWLIYQTKKKESFHLNGHGDLLTCLHGWAQHFLFSFLVIRTQPCKAHFPLQYLLSRGPRGCLKPMIHLPTLGNKTGTLPSGLFNTRLCLRALTEHIWVMEVLCPVWSQSRSKHKTDLQTQTHWDG